MWICVRSKDAQKQLARTSSINQGFKQSLTNAIGKVTEARLQLNYFGFNVPNAATMAFGCEEKRVSHKRTILVNDIKPWPNGVASNRKLRTWVYLRLRLAKTCVHLCWLAMTCAHFGWDQICTQVDASFSPFGHPIQVNASRVKSINLLLANEIQDRLP